MSEQSILAQTNCASLKERTGRLIMFIGNECQQWHIGDFIAAAHHAKELGCDAICPKRFDGTNRWYSDLKAEYTAVTALGVKYLPFGYCYGPTFGEQQIADECAILAEMQAACGGIAVANMEKEWNGQMAHAQSFAKHMQQLKASDSLLIISTWADPVQQNWQDVTKALLPVVDVWWPEQYTDWLAAQEQQLIDLGETCIQPTIDLSYPRNIDNYSAIAKEAIARGHTTISIWEYGSVAGNETQIREIAVLMNQTTTTPTKGTIMLNSHGEVADFPNVSQFEGGESAYECVAFAVAICHFAGQVGKGPTGTPEQIDQLADGWYAKLTGSFDSSNQDGMSVGQELRMIVGVGNHYQVLDVDPNTQHDHDIALVKGALLRGYPVIICGAETGMVDVGLGDIVPYGWTPRGNHAIVASGIAKDGNLLVRDQANVDSSGVRPGPRTYDIRYLDLISAVVFVPTWMPRPDGNTDFTQAPTAVIPTPPPVIPTPTPSPTTPPSPVIPPPSLTPTETAIQSEMLATIAMLRDGIDHLLAELSKLWQKEDTHV